MIYWQIIMCCMLYHQQLCIFLNVNLIRSIPILFSSLSRNTKHSISSLETQFVGFIELKLWQTVLGRTKKLKIILIARILSEKGGNSSVALFLSNWCPFTKYIMIFSSLCSITFYVAAESNSNEYSSNSNEYLYDKIMGSTVTVWLALIKTQFF